MIAPCNVDDDCAGGICEQGFCAVGDRSTPVDFDAGERVVPRDAGITDDVDGGDLAALDAGTSASVDAGVVVAPTDAGTQIDDAGAPLGPIPEHRYTFEEDASDVIGGAHGELKGGAVVALGAAVMDGDEAYVDLPNGIISALPALTVEAWVVWAGLTTAGGQTAYWQRVFDFGTNSVGEIEDVGGGTFTGTQFIQVTPQMTDDVLRLTGADDSSVVIIDGVRPADVGGATHIAVTFDPVEEIATLYVDGAPAGADPFELDLALLDDVNNWIGRSNYSADRGFYGSVTELRIYGSALSADEIAASFDRGEDDLGL